MPISGLTRLSIDFGPGVGHGWRGYVTPNSVADPIPSWMTLDAKEPPAHLNRAHLPLLYSYPGGVRRDTTVRGARYLS